MANPDIVKYISEQLQKGIAPGLITDKLRSAGWKEAEIQSALTSLEASSGSVASSDLHQEAASIKSQLKYLENRLSNLEAKLGVASKMPENATTYVARDAFLPAMAEKSSPAYSGASPEQFHEPERLESKITGKWFAALGILAIVFGVAFLLKYAFDNNIIGETGRVILGVLGGVIMLALGDFLSRREKYRQYSFFLSGGGLAILYLSIYSAFNYYHLISQAPAFIFMVIVTLIGAVLAIKQDSIWLSILSLLGGFLTPFLASSGENNYPALFSYLAILDLTYLVISYFKKWHKVYLLSFLGTYIVFYSWMAQYYEKALLGPSMFMLTIYFLIFLVGPFIMSLARKIKSENEDILAAVLNAGAYFITSYILLEPDFSAYLGFFFAGWAAAYILGAYVLSVVNAEDKVGILGLGGVGLVLATAAVPLQLSSIWITIAWAAEAMVLIWTGLTLKSKNIRVFAYIVFVLIIIRLFAFDLDSVRAVGDSLAFFNQRFMTFLFAIVMMFGATWLLASSREELEEGERSLPAIMGVVANLLGVFALSVEVGRIFDKKIYELNQLSQQPSIFAPAGGDDTWRQIDSIRNQQNLALSVIWGLYSGLLMLVGFAKRIRSIRILGIIGLMIVILKVFLYDMQALSDLYRIISFIALGVILLVISFLYYRFREKIKELVL